MWEFAIRSYSDEELYNELYRYTINKNNHAADIVADELMRRKKDLSMLWKNEAIIWRRIERPVYSRIWRVIHNLIAHPLLAIYRPIGQKLHDYTAEKMYKPNGKSPINYEAN